MKLTEKRLQKKQAEIDMMLNTIKQHREFFGYIPSSIGNIIYCDSTTPLQSKTSDSVRKKTWIVVEITAACGALVWAFLHGKPILSTILSIVFLIVAIIIIKRIKEFKGSDYFVGEEGFAIAAFEKNRNNITYKKEYQFSDFSELVFWSTQHYINYQYEGTTYNFSFFGKPSDGATQSSLTLKYFYSDKYYQPSLDAITDTKYLFYSKVESAWTSYKLKQILPIIRSKGEYTFNVGIGSSNTYIFSPYIKCKTDSIEIGDRIYNKDTLKSIDFKNGDLIVEHKNHKRILGVINKGNIEKIPIGNIGNAKLLTYYLASYFNKEGEFSPVSLSNNDSLPSKDETVNEKEV